MYAKGEEIKGTGHYDSNNHWVYDSNGTTSVLQHCIDVGVFCRESLKGCFYQSITKYFAKELNVSENVIFEFIPLMAALHDIGKVHPFFQKTFKNSINEMVKNNLILDRQVNNKTLKVRHEVVTREILEDYLTSKGLWYDDYFHLIEGFLYCLSSHHEKDTNKEMRLAEICVGEEIWEKFQIEILEEILKYFPFHWEDIKKFKKDSVDKVCLLFSALLIFSDWVASSFLSENYLIFEEYQETNNIEGYNNFYNRKNKVYFKYRIRISS